MNESAPDPAARMVRARERRNAGDFSGALGELESALQVNPLSAEAYCERGLTRLTAAATGWRIVKSAAFLTGLFESYDARIESLSCSRGAALKDALADFSRSIELEPERGDAWLARARLRRALASPEAWNDYERAVRLLPTVAAVLIERSGHRLNVRNTKEALEDAEAAVLLAPGDPEAFAARGWVRLSRQEAAGARKDFERALELDPGHLPSRVGRARSRAWDEPSGAREDHSIAAAATPLRPSDFYYRGLSVEAKGDEKQAKEDYGRAIDATPVWSPQREDLEKRLKETEKSTPAQRLSSAPITTLLLAICVGVLLVAESSGSTLNSDVLIRFGATERGHVWSGQYWRLVTSMFLHIGWVHLGWNVWAMFGWCGEVERLLGRSRFLAAYITTGVASSALSLAGHNFISAGASGAGFGMIGILLGGAFFKLSGLTPFLMHRGVMRILGWVAVWFVLGMTLMPFDNWGHLGGLLSGVTIGALWGSVRALPSASRRTAWAAFSVVLLALIAAAVHPWPFLYPNMKGWAEFSNAFTMAKGGDFGGAEAQYSRSYELGNRNEDLFFNRALARQAQKRFTEAIDDLDAALRLRPDRVEAYTLRGLCREAMGQTDEAVRDYNQGIEHAPSDINLRIARARLTLASGDVKAAVRDYREALRHAPPDWPQRGAIEKWLKENGH